MLNNFKFNHRLAVKFQVDLTARLNSRATMAFQRDSYTTGTQSYTKSAR